MMVLAHLVGTTSKGTMYIHNSHDLKWWSSSPGRNHQPEPCQYKTPMIWNDGLAHLAGTTSLGAMSIQNSHDLKWWFSSSGRNHQPGNHVNMQLPWSEMMVKFTRSEPPARKSCQYRTPIIWNDGLAHLVGTTSKGTMSICNSHGLKWWSSSPGRNHQQGNHVYIELPWAERRV